MKTNQSKKSRQKNSFAKKCWNIIMIIVLISLASYGQKYAKKIDNILPESKTDIMVRQLDDLVEEVIENRDLETTLKYEFELEKEDMSKEYDFFKEGYEEHITKINSKNKGLEKTLSQYRNKNTPLLALNKVKHPTYIVNEMMRIWRALGGKNCYVPYTIAYYESRFNTTCHNLKGEDSRGLFQVNWAVKAHKKRIPNPKKLFDPRYNMVYQFPELIYWEKRGIKKGLTGSALAKFVAKEGQRPSWKKWIEVAIDKAYKEYNSILISDRGA